MRVGIFVGEFDPYSGGRNTLQSTIINELKMCDSVKDEFIFFYSGGRFVDRQIELVGFKYYNIDREPSTVKKMLKWFWKRRHSIKECDYNKFDIIGKKYSIDIFWIITPWKLDITYPYIYTVWDLGHRMLPFFPEMSFMREWSIREDNYSYMLPRASYVLTGNEIGKREILENYSINADKIHIAPFPISSFCFGNESKPGFDLPSKYFFYPAQFWPHKNHMCILDALLRLKKEKGMNAKVFFTGTDCGNKAYIQKKVNEYGLNDNVIFTGFLEEKELKYIYTHATAMIYASLLGPNNLPPIEATYLGCPVIISDIPGHREQLHDAALYFGVENPSELSEQMYKVWSNEEIRNVMIDRGRALAVELGRIKYIDEVLHIFDEFRKMRRLWGN